MSTIRTISMIILRKQAPNRTRIPIRTRRCIMRTHTIRTNIIGMNIEKRES